MATKKVRFTVKQLHVHVIKKLRNVIQIITFCDVTAN